MSDFNTCLLGRLQFQVSRDRANAIQSQRKEGEDIGEPRQIPHLVVMFIDVRGSKDLQNSLPPDKFANFMRALIGDIREAVLNNDGMVDKLLGDGVMVLFSAHRLIPGDTVGSDAPSKDELADARRRALNCAATIIKNLEEKKRPDGVYDELYGHYGLPPKLGLGIGIVEGEALVGSFCPLEGRDKKFAIPPEISVFGMRPNIPAIANDLCELARPEKMTFVHSACNDILSDEADADVRRRFRGKDNDQRKENAVEFLNEGWEEIRNAAPNNTILLDVSGRPESWSDSVVPSGTSLVHFPCKCEIPKLKLLRSLAALLVHDD